MPRTLLAVHAHPDDESSKGAAVMARYADQGVRVVVVTCTGGEAGEILNPAMDKPGVLERMPELRRQELAKALEILDVTAHHWLGYRDSGMADSETNGHPDAFANADLEEATGRLVALIRAERPQVVLTYDEHGGYPHPDHIRTHEVSVAAFEAAGDPGRFPEAGRPTSRSSSTTTPPSAGPGWRRSTRGRWPAGSRARSPSGWSAGTRRRTTSPSRW